MSEIIAKVAQAIIDAHRERVDAFTVARRAIEAMREPTLPMLMQQARALWPYAQDTDGHPQQEWDDREIGGYEERYVLEAAAEGWVWAINEALK